MRGKPRKPEMMHDEHKFLSTFCFNELVFKVAAQHEQCPEDNVCDCPHHTDRRRGVVVRMK